MITSLQTFWLLSFVHTTLFSIPVHLFPIHKTYFVTLYKSTKVKDNNNDKSKAFFFHLGDTSKKQIVTRKILVAKAN